MPLSQNKMMLSQSKIISERVLRVVSCLKGKLGEACSIRRVALDTRLSYNSCYQAMMYLKQEGIVVLNKREGIQHCRLAATPKAVLVVSYLSVLEAERRLQKDLILRRIVEELLEGCKLEMESLVLFGSYARGQERKRSDIDLFGLAPEGKSMITLARHLGLKYDRQIQLIIASRKDFREMLQEQGLTVGKEVRDTGLVLAGSEAFWTIVLDSFKNKT